MPAPLSAREPAPALHYDPFAWEMHEYPYDTYRRLRDEAPAYHNAERGFWALSRYDDVLRAASDWRVFSSAAGVNLDQIAEPLGRGNFLNSDPPAHDQMRRILRPLFVPRAVAALEDEIRSQVRRLVADWGDGASVDLARALAWPLPLGVISSLLAIPAADRARLHERVMAFETRADGEAMPSAHSRGALAELKGYFRELVIARRRTRGSDVLSHAIAHAGDAAPLGDDDLILICLLLFVAGSETAAGLIGASFLALARHRDQARALARRPQLIGGAVEEILRYDSPIQGLARTTTADVECHGVTIPAGERVLLLFASANRDERRFPEPDRLNVLRPPERTLAFGHGIHFCLGVHLARLEGRVVLEELIEHLTDHEIGEPIERFHSHTNRAVLALPATFARRPRTARPGAD